VVASAMAGVIQTASAAAAASTNFVILNAPFPYNPAPNFLYDRDDIKTRKR
jgi:hypothetical protein